MQISRVVSILMVTVQVKKTPIKYLLEFSRTALIF